MKELLQLQCQVVPEVQYKRVNTDKFLVVYVHDGKPQCTAVQRSGGMCTVFLKSGTFEISSADLREHVYNAADSHRIAFFF